MRHDKNYAFLTAKMDRIIHTWAGKNAWAHPPAHVSKRIRKEPNAVDAQSTEHVHWMKEMRR